MVTGAAGPHSISSVPAAASRIALTKRRAVDFCRVATAICPAVPLSITR